MIANYLLLTLFKYLWEKVTNWGFKVCNVKQEAIGFANHTLKCVVL